MNSSARVSLMAAVGAATALIAAPASAATVVMSLSQLLQEGGGAYSGQFDISPALAGYEVVGARVIASGVSPIAYVNTPGPFSGYTYVNTVGPRPAGSHWGIVGYHEECGWSGLPYFSQKVCEDVPDYGQVQDYASDDHFERYRDLSHVDDVLDAMLLDVGESEQDGTAQSSLSTASPYYAIGGPHIIGGSFAFGYDYGTNMQRDVYSALYGPVSATAVLGVGDLADLNLDGVLDFNVLATTGRFTLTQATLEYELRAVTAEIPEPATWALMILGFGGSGVALRRARRRLAV